MSATAHETNFPEYEEPTRVGRATTMSRHRFARSQSNVESAVAAPVGGLGLVALLTLLTGAWGGIIAFVGPTFGYSADGSGSWQWSFSHSLLWLVPGAVAVVCALALFGSLPRMRMGVGRASVAFLGTIIAACGAWFAIGPLAWRVLRDVGFVFVPANSLRELAYQVGWSIGPGLLLMGFGGFTIAWAIASRPIARTSHLTAMGAPVGGSASTAPPPPPPGERMAREPVGGVPRETTGVSGTPTQGAMDPVPVEDSGRRL